jgi:predicted transcriptional regulator
MSIQTVLVKQIKAARALLGWSSSDLAAAASVSQPTIRRLEAEKGELGGYARTAKKLIDALERAGIEFTNGNSPGVRLKPATAFDTTQPNVESDGLE